MGVDHVAMRCAADVAPPSCEVVGAELRERYRNKLSWISLSPGAGCTYAVRTRCKRYAVQQTYAARDGSARFLAWCYPNGVPLDVLRPDRVSTPVGLFSIRRTLAQAKADAQHHARTGECRA